MRSIVEKQVTRGGFFYLFSRDASHPVRNRPVNVTTAHTCAHLTHRTIRPIQFKRKKRESGKHARINLKLYLGCLHEGVRYGSGSAMMSSRRCEYCYCISGARKCIRPKCLLPLPGCSPLYAPHSCCPVAYNCTRE